MLLHIACSNGQFGAVKYLITKTVKWTLTIKVVTLAEHHCIMLVTMVTWTSYSYLI